MEVKSASPGFDCRCGVPRRKDVSPHAAVLGTIATDGTGVKMPAMESVVGGVHTERLEYPWQVRIFYIFLSCGSLVYIIHGCIVFSPRWIFQVPFFTLIQISSGWPLRGE